MLPRGGDAVECSSTVHGVLVSRGGRFDESFCGPGEALSWAATCRVVMVGGAAFGVVPPLSVASVPKQSLLPNEVSHG